MEELDPSQEDLNNRNLDHLDGREFRDLEIIFGHDATCLKNACYVPHRAVFIEIQPPTPTVFHDIFWRLQVKMVYFLSVIFRARE